MKYLAYLGVALVAFWAGWVVKEANTPPPIVYLTKSEAVRYGKPDCRATLKQCLRKERM